MNSKLLKEFVQLIVENGRPKKWWMDPTSEYPRINPAFRDPENPEYIENFYDKMAEDPEYKPYIDAIKNASHPKELAKAKRTLLKALDAGTFDMPDGIWMSFYKKKHEELKDIGAQEKRMADPTKTTADARMDRLLRMRDSSGKATPRKF